MKKVVSAAKVLALPAHPAALVQPNVEIGVKIEPKIEPNANCVKFEPKIEPGIDNVKAEIKPEIVDIKPKPVSVPTGTRVVVLTPIPSVNLNDKCCKLEFYFITFFTA